MEREPPGGHEPADDAEVSDGGDAQEHASTYDADSEYQGSSWRQSEQEVSRYDAEGEFAGSTTNL